MLPRYRRAMVWSKTCWVCLSILQAAVCTDQAVAELLAALRPHGLVNKHLVHHSMTALQSGARAAQLREQLQIERYAAEQLPAFAERVCRHGGLLASLGVGWVALLLCCVMRMPQQRQAALKVGYLWLCLF
jgi:hypothetical protein